ncbi:phosphoribosylglycinamide formyltransferase, partial [Sistotremastrum suecicum HHB10207 ss-3]
RKLVVLISGSGTNLQALIDACESTPPTIPNTRIVLVLSNRKAAFGLTRAQKHNIPTVYLALAPYLKANPGKTRTDYDVEVAKIVVREKPDLVVLAGWMHVMSEGFLDIVSGERKLESEEGGGESFEVKEGGIPVINLHPALPGAFDGANALERAYEAYQKGEITKTGVMVHRVIKEVDRGEPVLVREIEIKEGETLEELEDRLHKIEWEVIVKATGIVLD